jgi:hypothetical protein
MGQAITVTVRDGVRGDVKHFELNRSLTGMQTHRYTAAEAVTGTKPPDELARRLFAHGGVDAVHVFSNVATVTLARGGSAEGMKEIVEGLYTYYREGVTPAIP